LDRATLVAETVAAAHADDVDRLARFPIEAVDALRDHRLLSCAIPVELGGAGLSVVETSAIARVLGQHCASTGMIFAMHQAQIFSLFRHAGAAAIRDFVAEVAANQLLLASATTEIGIGGDVRRSSCFVEPDGDRVRLVKNAPVISYGEHCDAILATARRTGDSPPSDQVLVVCRAADSTLELTGTWDTFGLRGTRSPGFILRAVTDPGLVVPEPYADVSARTQLPISHIMWSSVWLGIADNAMDKARRFVRTAARKQPGAVPPGAVRLAETDGLRQQLGELILGCARRFDTAVLNGKAGEADLTSIRFSMAMNSLKVTSSQLAVDIVSKAMLICGIAAYREDTEYRLGRQLRDAHGAAVMVNNDRIMANNAQLALAVRGY
jgi:acyl-CoA dehydrogenase